MVAQWTPWGHAVISMAMINLLLTVILVILYATGVWRIASFLKFNKHSSGEANETKDQGTEPSVKHQEG